MGKKDINIFRLLLPLIFCIYIILVSGSMNGLNFLLNNSAYAVMYLFGLAAIYMSIFYIIYSYVINKNFSIFIGNIKLIFIMILFLVLGLYGSISINLTIKGIVFLISYILFSLIMIDQFNDKELSKYLLVGFLIVIFMNIIYTIIFPYSSFNTFDSRFKSSLIGMFYHKNSFASFIALSNLIILINIINQAKTNKRKQVGLIAIYILTIILVIMSNSKTSLVIILVCNTLIIIYKLFKFRFNVIGWLMGFHIMFYTVILGSRWINDIFVKILGRDLTLTDRVDIWKVLIEFIKERPIIGFGYNTIWNIDEVVYHIKANVGFDLLGGHNGPLQILVEIGIIGFAGFIIIFFIIPAFELKYLDLDNNKFHMFIYIFYAYILIYSISESIFSPENFQTFLIIFIVVYINKYKYRRLRTNGHIICDNREK